MLHEQCLSPDDFGRVAAMASALPPRIDLGDEREVMLSLHRQRFPAIDIAVLAPFVVEKARELREFFGLTSLCEVIGGAGLLIAIVSLSFLGCIGDAITASAHAAEAGALAPAVTDKAMFIPAFWTLFLAAGLLLSVVIPGADHGLHDLSLASAIFDEDQVWSEAQQEAFERDAAEQTRRAWHWHIAAGMSGEF